MSTVGGISSKIEKIRAVCLALKSCLWNCIVYIRVCFTHVDCLRTCIFMCTSIQRDSVKVKHWLRHDSLLYNSHLCINIKSNGKQAKKATWNFYLFCLIKDINKKSVAILFLKKSYYLFSLHSI